MPIYEYQCSKCQRVFEEWLKASEMTDTCTCTQCGGEAHHIMSHTSFVLKGGGWYVDDYGYRKGVTQEDTASSSADKAKSLDGTAASTDTTTPAAESNATAHKASETSTPAKSTTSAKAASTSAA